MNGFDFLNGRPAPEPELVLARREIEALRAEVDRLQRSNEAMARTIDDLQRQPPVAETDASVEMPITLQPSETLRNLVMAAEYRDHDTGAHLVRIGYLCALLAPVCGCNANFSRELLIASPMHDIGKIGIPDGILKKRGLLSEEERRIMERHTEYGARILGGSRLPVLRLAAEIARTHHERFDGSGYPHGLKGRQIPLSGRIVAVVDVFDALAMDRNYRVAMPAERALDIIMAGRGTQFDSAVVDAFFSVVDEVLELRDMVNRGERPKVGDHLVSEIHGNPLGFYDSPLHTTPATSCWPAYP
jgi:putative two-component system response regulator